MEEVHKGGSSSSSVSSQPSAGQGTTLQAAQLSHIAQQVKPGLDLSKRFREFGARFYVLQTVDPFLEALKEGKKKQRLRKMCLFEGGSHKINFKGFQS